MTEEQHQLVQRFTDKMYKLIEYTKALETKNGRQKEEIEALEQQIKAVSVKLSEREEQISTLNMALSLTSIEKRASAEEQVADLMREIDKCIELLTD